MIVELLATNIVFGPCRACEQRDNKKSPTCLYRSRYWARVSAVCSHEPYPPCGVIARTHVRAVSCLTPYLNDLNALIERSSTVMARLLRTRNA